MEGCKQIAHAGTEIPADAAVGLSHRHAISTGHALGNDPQALTNWLVPSHHRHGLYLGSPGSNPEKLGCFCSCTPTSTVAGLLGSAMDNGMHLNMTNWILNLQALPIALPWTGSGTKMGRSSTWQLQRLCLATYQNVMTWKRPTARQNHSQKLQAESGLDPVAVPFKFRSLARLPPLFLPLPLQSRNLGLSECSQSP